MIKTTYRFSVALFDAAKVAFAGLCLVLAISPVADDSIASAVVILMLSLLLLSTFGNIVLRILYEIGLVSLTCPICGAETKAAIIFDIYKGEEKPIGHGEIGPCRIEMDYCPECKAWLSYKPWSLGTYVRKELQ